MTPLTWRKSWKFYCRLKIARHYICIWTPLAAARLAWNMPVERAYLIESGWTFGFVPKRWNLSLDEGRLMYRYHWADIKLEYAAPRAFGKAP